MRCEVKDVFYQVAISTYPSSTSTACPFPLDFRNKSELAYFDGSMEQVLVFAITVVDNYSKWPQTVSSSSSNRGDDKMFSKDIQP